MGIGFDPTVAVVASGFETLTVSNVVKQPTESKMAFEHGPATYGFFTVETDSIRFTCDGTEPTASIGHLVTAGQDFEICGTDNLKRLRMIRVTTDATVQCTYAR